MSKRALAVVTAVIVLALGAGYFIGSDIGYDKAVKDGINSFEECADTGYPIMESFPEQCAVPDGKSFTKNY